MVGGIFALAARDGYVAQVGDIVLEGCEIGQASCLVCGSDVTYWWLQPQNVYKNALWGPWRALDLGIRHRKPQARIVLNALYCSLSRC